MPVIINIILSSTLSYHLTIFPLIKHFDRAFPRENLALDRRVKRESAGARAQYESPRTCINCARKNVRGGTSGSETDRIRKQLCRDVLRILAIEITKRVSRHGAVPFTAKLRDCERAFNDRWWPMRAINGTVVYVYN